MAELTARQREALDYLDKFCMRRQTGTVTFHIKDGVVCAVELGPVIRIQAAEASAVLASYGQAKEINIAREPGSSSIKLRVVEHRQLRIASR